MMMMVLLRCLDEENGEWKMIQNSFQLFLKELNAIRWHRQKSARRIKLNPHKHLLFFHCSPFIQRRFPLGLIRSLSLD
jgi:hypothetical protein